MLTVPRSLLRPVAAGLAALALVGCATRRLPQDFGTYSRAYADNMNWQMLLNLARLDQGHPAYFMAIGEVRLTRNATASLQGTGNTARTETEVAAAALSRTLSTVTGGNAQLAASQSATPSFIFIPINSEEASRQLLSPISIDVFNTLFQQGWPADQFMRVLVERIEVEIHENGQTRQVVLVNSPTRGTPESFARFLRAAEIVRALQRSGGISLVTTDKFTPASSATIPAPGARELLDAADKGRAWQPAPPPALGWQLGTARSGYRFQTDAAVLDAIIADFEKREHPEFGDSLQNLRAVLGATLGANPSEPGRATGTRSVLVLRSFRNVLESVAQEQRAFDLLLADPGFRDQVPARQRQPILRTEWSAPADTLEKPLLSLDYAGRTYRVTDPTLPATDPAARWNRDVFRLLVDLSTQVTVDITKFQRQTLELSR